MGSGAGTQLIGLGRKHLCILSPLTSVVTQVFAKLSCLSLPSVGNAGMLHTRGGVGSTVLLLARLALTPEVTGLSHRSCREPVFSNIQHDRDTESKAINKGLGGELCGKVLASHE